jgi:RNA methyltransferase, TrmH family
MEVIASRKNPLVALMRRVAAGEERERMLLDGLHLVEEARGAQASIQTAAFSPRVLASADGVARRLATMLAGVGVRVVQASDPVMDAMSPVASPTGVVAIAARPRHTLADLVPPGLAEPFLLVAVDVQDPGNVGGMARVAEAAGASGLIAAGASADPFGWKALRGSMGSALRLPIVRDADAAAVVDLLAARGVRVIAAAPGPASMFDEVDWRPPTAVLLGSEGAGLPAEILRRADQRVSIPMASPVESLNVAVSAALIAYQARRQRRPAR